MRSASFHSQNVQRLAESFSKRQLYAHYFPPAYRSRLYPGEGGLHIASVPQIKDMDAHIPRANEIFVYFISFIFIIFKNLCLWYTVATLNIGPFVMFPEVENS
jgi:hypothetical protein